MKFLILYLLMTLAVVFALPTNMEKRGDIRQPKSNCNPTTLTWSVRGLDSGTPQESFRLVVRNTYSGRISSRSPKNRKTISSGDSRFSVNHGSYTRNEPLTLTYQGTRYNFARSSHVNTVNSDDGLDVIGKDYEYWACL
ncbi:hypothetical protein BKA57DRAFT_460999 [Linnemannia elongata]|nr:hypothetical protein BKA57DRAFT_460999 [Linnemannia elongata]